MRVLVSFLAVVLLLGLVGCSHQPAPVAVEPGMSIFDGISATTSLKRLRPGRYRHGFDIARLDQGELRHQRNGVFVVEEE